MAARKPSSSEIAYAKWLHDRCGLPLPDNFDVDKKVCLWYIYLAGKAKSEQSEGTPSDETAKSRV